MADYLPDLHRTAGGAEYAARRTIEEQVRAGLEVEVATLPADFTRQGAPWQRRHEMRNIDRHAPRVAYALKQLFRPQDPVAARGLESAIRASRPDVVHYHNLHYAGLSTVEVARRLGVPSAWTIYDYWIFCPSFMLLRSDGALCSVGHGRHCVDCIGTRRARAARPLKALLFQRRPAAFAPARDAVDRFVVLSEASAQMLEHHGIDRARIAVIPQHGWKEAIDLPVKADPEPGRLLYVGWVEPRKGLHVVLRALALVAPEFPQMRLEVLGMAADMRYRAEMEALAGSSALAGRVSFREKVSRPELLEELRRAWLVTVPEQWENMSPVILTEAMAAGACVLASRVGGVPQFVQDGIHGLLATRDDPDDFARQMRWAMQNPARVLLMRHAARERASSAFDSADIDRRTRALYESLTAPSRARES